MGRITHAYSWYNEFLPQRTPLSQTTSDVSTMLASRTLPPIYPRSPPSPPLAIFRSIPRRYVKSNMRAGEHASPRTEKIQSSRQLRKDSKAIDTSTESTLSPVRRTSEFHGPIYAPSSPRLTRKRAAPFEEDVEGLIFDDEGSPTDIRAPQSASSTGSGELLGHVCLCQPEPKIPRPRNGKSDLFFICDASTPKRLVLLGDKEPLFVCGCIFMSH